MTGGYHEEEEVLRGDNSRTASRNLSHTKHIFCGAGTRQLMFTSFSFLSAVETQCAQIQFYLEFSKIHTHTLCGAELTSTVAAQYQQLSLRFMVCSTITPAFSLYPCASAADFETRRCLTHRIILLLSSLSVFCGNISCKLPHSHCFCPAWLPLRSFYLSCWSLSVGRCPHISIQPPFPGVYHGC